MAILREEIKGMMIYNVIESSNITESQYDRVFNKTKTKLVITEIKRRKVCQTTEFRWY